MFEFTKLHFLYDHFFMKYIFNRKWCGFPIQPND